MTTSTNTNIAAATIIIASNASALSSYQPTHTVEAEFGQAVVEGSVATLAHHGPRDDQPCPCLGDNLPKVSGKQLIAVSHFDLDTLGGVMRCLGVKEPLEGDLEDMFWTVASMVDTMGVHKLPEIRNILWREATADVSIGTEEFNIADHFFCGGWDDTIDQLNAFWAWSESNRLFPHREGFVTNVTEFFSEAIRVVSCILEMDDMTEHVRLIAAGKKWADAKETLAKESFITGIDEVVIIRSSDQFTNHLYTHGDWTAMAVVAFNEKFKSVTVSLADPVSGVNCCDLVQKLWGPEAGGHAGIAGSPRGQEMLPADAEDLADLVSDALASAG